ncbi:MAG TPA: TIGR03668 family PPOX class F420-dependent oxidoreductase [Solirubrobacteraceae bacterium]|nr:TIGR03668 family PPOX class F420-dependent oxidoreductase [Solirubrobacteraceae bacterium]
MDEARCRALLAAARVGRLATVRPDGRPHVVACCFALAGDRVWTAVDAKPKSTPHLQRLANVRAHPSASLLADHYEEDWGALWWVRVDGTAAVLERGPERDEAIAALAAKYAQYAAAPPAGAVIAIAAERFSGWTAAG